MVEDLVSPSVTVTRARKAFNNGFTKEVRHRLLYLKNFQKFLEENEETIVKTMFEDTRKHREEARLEIIIAVNHVRYLIDKLKEFIKPEKPPKRLVDILDGIYVHPDPYGVVLVMGAWNVPLLTLVPVTGAIAAGNCVVIKPSHVCPRFGQMLATILPTYLDPTCFPVFLGDIDQTNELLAERFDYIYYTGSSTVGKIVHAAANKYLTPTTLELGGKSPAYIDPSANLELAATRIMWGKCFNSGQICISPDYILCQKSVQDKFIEHAKAALIRFYQNDPNCCPIVNERNFKRLQQLLSGLNVVVGGRCNPYERSIEPTIAIDVSADHPVMQEEIFGPILPIITTNGFKEAAEFINRRDKPLALYVFTEDSSVRDYLIENTSSGGVTVNDTLMQLMVESLPFGGVGLSGMGRYKGKDSFETFVHRKSVLVKNSSRLIEKINEVRYPPYSDKKTNITGFLLRYRKGISWGWVPYVIIFLIGFISSFLIFNYV